MILSGILIYKMVKFKRNESDKRKNPPIDINTTEDNPSGIPQENDIYQQNYQYF